MGLAAKIVVGAGAVAVATGAAFWLFSSVYCERRANDAIAELRTERGDVSAEAVAERAGPFISRALWCELTGIVLIVAGLAAVYVAVRWPGAPGRGNAER